MKTDSKFSYDAAMAQIEEIVGKLETQGGTIGFDEMIADVEKALGLIGKCKKSIADAEERLAKLNEAND